MCPPGEPQPGEPGFGEDLSKLGREIQYMKGLRPPGYKDMDSYVPGRLPYLPKRVEEVAREQGAPPHQPAPSTKAVCQRCKLSLPMPAPGEGQEGELQSHLAECWAPSSSPPVCEGDGREHRPSLMGQVAGEEDTPCLLFTATSPGPCGGEYLLTIALPREAATLQALDSFIRELWFPLEVDHWRARFRDDEDDRRYLSMFLMRSPEQEGPSVSSKDGEGMEAGQGDASVKQEGETVKREGGTVKQEGGTVKQEGGTVEQEGRSVEEKLYRGYLPNAAAADLASGSTGVTEGLLRAGRLVWAREWGGVLWPAVCLAEASSGLVGRLACPQGRHLHSTVGQQWHLVFIGRGNTRAWVPADMDVFELNPGWDELELTTKKGIAKAMGSALNPANSKFRDSVQEEEWLAAMKEGVRLHQLHSDTAVLARVAELGLTGDGELLPQTDYMERLMWWSKGQSREEVEARNFDTAREHGKWSFMTPYQPGELPVALAVQKEPGFQYWPLQGGAEVDRVSLLQPDREDMELSSIFQTPGQEAFWHFHLVAGYTNRCRLVYRGEQVLRLRGVLDTPWMDAGRLERDPEYRRDMKRCGRDDDLPDPTEVDWKTPPAGPVLLARNSPPFLPCLECGLANSQWCQVKPDEALAVHWRSWEDPDRRLQELFMFCSVPCGLAWTGGTDRRNPRTDGLDLAQDKGRCGDGRKDVFLQLANSPRSGVPPYGQNDQIRLHVIHEGVLYNDYIGYRRLPGFNIKKMDGDKRDEEFHDDERPRYRHHPLWTKQARRRFRDIKRRWQVGS